MALTVCTSCLGAWRVDAPIGQARGACACATATKTRRSGHKVQVLDVLSLDAPGWSIYGHGSF